MKRQWDFLKNQFEKNQLGHAYLFSGQEESNKILFAKEFLKLINCLPSADLPQGDKMIEGDNFPDVMMVKSKNSESSEKNERDMMSIEIGQVRDVQNFLSLTPYFGNYKAVIVQDAERMTIEAQNCFLKTLEEPRGKTIIILVSSRPNLLLPTVLSRCQEIKFFYSGKYEVSKDQALIMKSLENVMGGSLAEKFQYAKNANLEADNFNNILATLRKHFRKLMLDKIMGKGEKSHYTVNQIKKIIDLIEYINSQTYITNVNNKLALEVLLMEI